jgi:hypothetical protein
VRIGLPQESAAYSDGLRRSRYTWNVAHFIYRLIHLKLFENLGDVDRAALEAGTFRTWAKPCAGKT